MRVLLHIERGGISSGRYRDNMATGTERRVATGKEEGSG
jgi:hypothetical protein